MRTHAAPSPVIAGSSTGLPPHVYPQARLAELMTELLASSPATEQAIARMFAATGVAQRHLALAPDGYRELAGFGGRCSAWIEVATELGEGVVAAALADGGVEPAEVGLLLSTTVTGVAVPSLDARLMNRIAFAASLKRAPLFGLGCVGGAAGLARVADYLRGHPGELALLLSVELCSLTFQAGDESIANVIATGLFGDGAAAVLIAGAEHPIAQAPEHGFEPAGARAPRPSILASRSAFFPATEAMMGWDIVDTGFAIVLSPEVPALVERELPGLVDDLLAEHGLRRAEIAAWIAHPGGPKVIDAVERGLELEPGQLAASRAGLARFGNLSSASVLFLLDEFRRERAPAPGSHALLFALGPAFCAELVLLRW